MLTLRLNAKHSTFTQLMELEVWPSTASYVLMVHSSTNYYFICDWWFNLDCSTEEDYYSLKDEIAVEREALAEAAADIPEEYGALFEEE